MEGIPEAEISERVVYSRDASIRTAMEKGISLEEYKLNQEFLKSQACMVRQED